jgi:hypothetical protein
MASMRGDHPALIQRGSGSGLVDVLDRVLDKGLVVAGDIKISLAEVELLTIRIRLIVCSIDKAQAMGLDWWKHDPHLSPGRSSTREIERLRAQVALLEEQLQERMPAPRRRGANGSRRRRNAR